MTSLSTLFSIGAIVLYLSSRNAWFKKPFSTTAFALFTASLLSWTLALFSKENAVVIPLIILLIELTLYSNNKPWSYFKTLPKQKKLSILVTIFISSLLALLWAMDYASGGFNNRPFTMLERVLTESRVLCFYISLIIIPRLNAFGLFHDDITLSTSLITPWTTFTSIIFIIGLLTIAFKYRKKNPLFTLGIGWFFIGHLLESTFFPLEIAHEHRNNLPSMGIILALTSLLPPNLINGKKAILGFIVIASIFSGSTYLRASQWGNKFDHAYFESLHHPNSPSAQYTYSSIALREGKINEAFKAINKAITLSPKETAFLIHFQRYLAQGKVKIPRETQEKTLLSIQNNKITPTTELALDKLTECFEQGACLALLPNYLEWINIILKKTPSNSFYHLLNGKALLAAGQEKAAIIEFQESHSLDPKYLHPLFKIINIYIENKDIRNASITIKRLKLANKTAPIPRFKEISQVEEKLQLIMNN